MYLTKIIDYKKQELESQKRKVSLKDVRLKADDTEPARDFLGALRKSQTVKIIAEVKKASPSAGIIRTDFDPLQIAQVYEENGASALSVLTDEHFFQGKLDYLTQIHSHVKIPLLRKDFTVDAYHLYEARGAGADAVLLIACVLEAAQLKDYADLADELGLTALIEIHDEKDLEKTLGVIQEPPLLGINNRNLQTFKVDLETSVRLASKIPAATSRVSESGISTREHIQKLQKSGIHTFLIGESLMRLPDFGRKLQELLQS